MAAMPATRFFPHLPTLRPELYCPEPGVPTRNVGHGGGPDELAREQTVLRARIALLERTAAARLAAVGRLVDAHPVDLHRLRKDGRRIGNSWPLPSDGDVK